MDYQQTLHDLLKYDIGRSAYFDVHIYKKLGGLSNFVEDKVLTFLCYSAELPGETLATIDSKIYGVVEKHPILASYNNINLDFYTRGSDFDTVRAHMMEWMVTATGRSEVLSGNLYAQTTYNVAYKKDISGLVIINHYSVDGKLLTSCKLIDAFPVGISGAKLDWSMENGAMNLSVAFAFTEYEYSIINSSAFGSNVVNPLNVVNPIGNNLLNGIKYATNPNSTVVNGVTHLTPSQGPIVNFTVSKSF